MHHPAAARRVSFGSLILLCLLAAPLCAAAPAAPASSPQVASPLIVGVTVAPPFVIADGEGHYHGLGISVWQRVARDNGWQFRYQEYDLQDLLADVRSGKVDVGMGGITATAPREQAMDFAHPVTSSGLSVAVRDQHRSGWMAVVRAIFSWTFLKIVVVLAILLLVVGFLVWAFEHKRNPEQFGGTRSQGVFSGFWWAMVTMTTVGYGDTAPVTVGGRILGLLWMLAALVVVSFFTASMTSALTVGQLSQRVRGAGDLAGMHIASVPHSTSAAWLDNQRIRYNKVATLDDALAQLANGKVDAVVYDKPLLQYKIEQHYHSTLHVLPLILERQDYAFALPEYSPLRQGINTSVLKQINAPDWKSRIKEYVDVPEPQADM